jgi:hypothetical protein
VFCVRISDERCSTFGEQHNAIEFIAYNEPT